MSLIARIATDQPARFPNVRRRQLLCAAGAAVLTLGPMQLAWGAQLVAVRVWPAEDYTRVTLESDTPLLASHQMVSGPDRLVVDVEGLQLNATLRELVAKITPNDPYIQLVRVGQYQPHVVRLVFDLKDSVLPQVFTLPPVGGYKYRLVFDLYPTHPPDPLMQLVMASVNKQLQLDAQASSASAAPSGPEVPESGSVAHEDPIAVIARRNSAETPSSSGALAQAVPPPAQGQPSLPAQPVAPSAIRRPAPPAMEMAETLGAGETERGERQSSKLPRMRRLITVALDPGHGGEDPGAIGARGTYEKRVVMSIAHRLREKIDAQPNMRAMLTRDADFFVPLHVRVQKARRVQADLFVSIHADAFVNQQARGASVYALSERGASSAAAKWIANRENASDLIGGVNVGTHDPQVARVLLDLSTTAQIKDSLRVGHAVLNEIGDFAHLHKAKVEQASFAVLKAPDIPSILVETAFISNPEEEARLNDEGYQDRIADAIMRGIRAYFAKNPPLSKNPSV